MEEANCHLRFLDYCLECRVRIYNLTPVTTLKFVEAIPTQKLLVTSEIFPVYANSYGMTGAIFRIIRPPSLTTKKYFVASLDQPEGKGMNYHGGYSSPTAMLYPAGPFGHYNMLSCIVEQKNANRRYLMLSLRGDMDCQ